VSEAAVQLTPEIQKLASDFELENGRVLMPDEQLSAWCDVLTRVSPNQRITLATELIALAFKFARRAGDQAAIAITQLFVLATHLLGSRAAAEEAFQQAGIDPREAARLTGRKVDPVVPQPMAPTATGVGLRKK
jgi:hypothetical protein